MVKLNTVKGTISFGSKEYVLYTGFIKAQDILSIAHVPSFHKEKPNITIAENLRDSKLTEWQRPLLQKKVDAIIDLYSNALDVKVMPNGVLFGVDPSSLKPDSSGKASIFEPTQQMFSDFYEINIETSNGRKPLFVLDGQHRVEGMSQSLQKDQLIPFVICQKGFTVDDLAEIFTHVTTEATEMKPLHKAWMQYSFKLGPFKSWQQQAAGKTAILMCTEAGSFKSKIKFNDDVDVAKDTTLGGFNQDQFTFRGWSQILYKFFYSKFTNEATAPNPEHVASTIGNMVDALRNSDSDLSKSKFFTTSTTNKYHATLCTVFMQEFLLHLSDNVSKLSNTLVQWTDFLTSSPREWHKVKTDLPYVLPMGQNANDLDISKRVARACFKLFFNNPSGLSPVKVHQFLQGESGFFTIFAYKANSSGKPDMSTEQEYKVDQSQAVNICDDGVQRTIIRFGNPSENWIIKRPMDSDYVEDKYIPGILVKNPSFDLSVEYPGTSEKKMKLWRHSYHSSSRKLIELTINW